MFFRRKQEAYLPSWLWFFLILPVGLISLLLYRQNRLPGLIRRLRMVPQAYPPPRRYVEPDSIPLEMHSVKPAIPVEGLDAGAKDEGAKDAGAAGAAVSQGSGLDDLVVIEGIGPKIAGLLNSQGITTYHQLAETPVDDLDKILANAGLRRLADPGTWPEQALLAAEHRWDDLKQLQGTLKGGRRSKTG